MWNTSSGAKWFGQQAAEETTLNKGHLCGGAGWGHTHLLRLQLGGEWEPAGKWIIRGFSRPSIARNPRSGMSPPM